MFVTKRHTRFDLLLLSEDEYYLSDESVVLLATQSAHGSLLDTHKYVICLLLRVEGMVGEFISARGP